MSGPGLAWILVALAATRAAPLGVLVWLPLLLGVPHVLADLRYLLSPGAPARVRLPAASIACLVLLALHRCGGLAGLPFSSSFELGLGVAALGAALLAREAGEAVGPAGRLGLLALAGALIAWPVPALAAIAHLHNFTAMAIWARLADGGPARLGPVAAAYLAALAAIGLGGLDGALPDLVGSRSALGMIAPLAPGLGPLAVGRVALSYAFAQILHYAVWLHLVPGIAAARRARRAEPGSWLDDLGTVPALAGLAAAVAVPVAGWFDPIAVRTLYLGAAGFHAWLEWAVLARGLPGARPA